MNDAAYFQQRRPEMLQTLPDGLGPHHIVLEIGSGEGTFAESVISKFGCQYWAVESNPAAFNIVRERVDHAFCAAFPDEIDLTGQQFDCIIFNDVLEHLADPWNAMRATHALLKDDGKLVSSIPNFLYYPNLRNLLLSRDWVYRESGILDRTHLRFFTRKSINRLHEDAGFRIQSQRGISLYQGRGFLIMNRLTKGALDDFQPAQYATVAGKNTGSKTTQTA